MKTKKINTDMQFKNIFFISGIKQQTHSDSILERYKKYPAKKYYISVNLPIKYYLIRNNGK